MGVAAGDAADVDEDVEASRDRDCWRAGGVGEEISVWDSEGDPVGTSAEADAFRRCRDSAIASRVGSFTSCGTSYISVPTSGEELTCQLCS